ncbi:hypothetical protein QOZ80_6AG0509920 [Eleusine coracana subsp. coracana]|nr:hypothetical protein QOZ80_6AG0509920 [Eleusine coracana subsp. coracana]
MLLRHHPIRHLVQVNSHPRPPRPTAALMASLPLNAFVATLLLLLAGAGAAQSDESVPPPPALPPTNAFDVAALREVFQRWGLEGDAARGADPCQKRFWFESFGTIASIGCSCSSVECRVTHLNVTGYWNITEIPLALFNLTELVSLDLSNNNLSGSIPQEVASLSKLETWHFNNNHLSGSFPPGSSLLRNLQSLWMFDTYIDGPIPEFIQNLTNLKDLRIYGMKLHGPVPTNFSKLINLEYLMLGDLDGNNSSFGFIGNWANLSTLSLRKCGLMGHLPGSAPNLQKLNYLDLRSNNLSGPIVQLLPYKNSDYIFVGENNFNGHLPSEIVQASFALDVSNNPLVTGTLPNNPAGRKWPINYIRTSIDASRTIDSEDLAILNCRQRKECNRNNLTNSATSLAINCGGKQIKTSDSSPTVFSEDSTDLGGAGFHVNNASHWVVSHVGVDPFSQSLGIVNTSQDILETNIPQLYQTARTSTGALWYYVVGLANRKYTVQLFFAEIVIDGPGRRLFDIDIQGQNIKKDFNIIQEAGGPKRPTSITHEVIVNDSILVIHLYWSGRGTCCIPYRGAYGPLVSAIKVFPSQDMNTTPSRAPPQAPHSARQDDKRRGVVAGIAALCIAGAVISSSVVYLWWKWVSLVKHPMA